MLSELPTVTRQRDLRARLIARDTTALAELYDEFAAGMYGLAHRVSGDRQIAEDVTHEVFLRVWRRAADFDPDRGSLRSWLAVQTHSTTITWLRREAALRRRQDRHIEGQAPAIAEVEDMACSLLTADRARKAVESLPVDQRRAIELAYFGGLTYRRVAELMGVPPGTAKSRIRLGLRRLSQTLLAEVADAAP